MSEFSKEEKDQLEKDGFVQASWNKRVWINWGKAEGTHCIPPLENDEHHSNHINDEPAER